MNDDEEVCVVEMETFDGFVEVVDPQRIRIGTRTAGELREHNVDPDQFEKKNIQWCRKFPEHTLKVKRLKDLK